MNIVGIPALVDTYENYIWVLHGESGNEQNAWIVDPGESEPVINYLETHHLQPQAILVTHQHHDHVNGIRGLKAAYPNLTVYGPEKSQLPIFDIRCKEGDEISLSADLHLKVLDTPGHTPDHIAYYNDDILFCGDTLFTGGCGRVLGGTVEQFSDSIMKLRALPDHLGFYSAHEYTTSNLAFAKLAEPENAALQNRLQQTQINYPALHQGAQSTLGLEKQTNPFLRFDLPELKQQLFARGADQNAASLFATLRAWKDDFDRSH